MRPGVLGAGRSRLSARARGWVGRRDETGCGTNELATQLNEHATPPSPHHAAVMAREQLGGPAVPGMVRYGLGRASQEGHGTVFVCFFSTNVHSHSFRQPARCGGRSSAAHAAVPRGRCGAAATVGGCFSGGRWAGRRPRRARGGAGRAFRGGGGRSVSGPDVRGRPVRHPLAARPPRLGQLVEGAAAPHVLRLRLHAPRGARRAEPHPHGPRPGGGGGAAHLDGAAACVAAEGSRLPCSARQPQRLAVGV
jgi:hypothetical protein